MIKTMRTEKERLENVAEFAFQLDERMGLLGEHVITLNDIHAKLSELRVKMDNMNNLQIQFDDFHRTTRMLNDLMVYIASDITENYKDMEKLKDKLFQVAVKESIKNEQEKSPTSSKTLDQ